MKLTIHILKLLWLDLSFVFGSAAILAFIGWAFSYGAWFFWGVAIYTTLILIPFVWLAWKLYKVTQQRLSDGSFQDITWLPTRQELEEIKP